MLELLMMDVIYQFANADERAEIARLQKAAQPFNKEYRKTLRAAERLLKRQTAMIRARLEEIEGELWERHRESRKRWQADHDEATKRSEAFAIAEQAACENS
jgi:hypothetical protein